MAPEPKQKKSPRTRDAWLQAVSGAMTSWYADLGFPLPPFEIRSGFPSVGRRSPNITDSWSQDGGQSYVIFVRPDRGETIDVAAAVAFQMCRIAVGDRDAHGYLFRHIAISIGLRGTKTESPPGTLFKELIKPTIDDAGPIPVQEMSSTDQGKKTTQSTRLLKVYCKDCGYVARVSRKWLDAVGTPHCPDHGPMTKSD